jgi:cytochrome c5
MMNVNNSLIKKIAIVLSTLLMGAVLTAQATTESQRAAIEARIKPVGEVCIEGDSSCGMAVVASSGPRTGEDIYNSSCMACHGTGVPGSPQLGDVAEWNTRVDKGLEVVYSNAINGIGGMPAKGTCMSCSDDEINATVDYMVAQSQ